MAQQAAMPSHRPHSLARHRWTTDEFDRLVAQGFLREGSRTFLWAGEIVEPMAEGPRHVNALENLRREFERRLAEPDWTINQAHPLRLLADGYQPQPDLAVLVGPRASYRRRKPTPADVALLVEVARSTYAFDAGELLQRYAREGIARYWIVNVEARRVEVYTDPDPAEGRYRDRHDYGLDETVPLVLSLRGVLSEFEGIDVMAILRDSLDDEEV